MTGRRQPIEDIRRLLVHRPDVVLVLDCAQAAGHQAIACGDGEVVVFAGHKALLGPPGIGGLVIGRGVRLTPLIVGGSGGNSASSTHPRWLPDALEAGTLNGVGIAGLSAGVAHVQAVGLDEIGRMEAALTSQLITGLRELSAVTLYSAGLPGDAPVVSFEVGGVESDRVARFLDEKHGVMTRAGLHCAPLTHKALGTFERGGLVRFSLSHQNDEEDVQAALDAVGALLSAEGLS